MGTVNESKVKIKSKMSFCECSKCNSVQIKELIDPKILYMNNHNTGIIGDIWNQHYVELINFIGDSINDKRILEIGDPSCKISKNISKRCKEWIIVENNIDTKKIPENVRFIKKWFDKDFNEGFFDVILHSHFLEHSLDPITIIKKINQSLINKGSLIFSVPNLEYLLNNQYIPNNILHFEHTFFYTMNDMKKLLEELGFLVEEIKEYKNHSLFFRCKKIKEPKNEFKMEFDKTSKKFMVDKRIKKSIRKFNSIIGKKYIFGSHISTQSIISLGVNHKDVICILDNNKTKTDNFLYGTDLITKLPEIIKEEEKPIIFVSHCSVYKEEISSQIMKINKNAILI